MPFAEAAEGTIHSLDERIDDALLVVHARSGSLDALGELYSRHADTVYDAALRLLASAADAEDVLQDVFVGLPAALRRYEERGALGSWLRRLAVRRALMLLRTSRRYAASPAAEQSVGAGSDPGRRLDAHRVIAALPAALRTVFVLKEIEGYSHEEIGMLLDITARASALRLHRAWKIVRRNVEGSC